MTDYGHPLRFGTFITPTNSPPDQPGRLAVLCEELGYDLVTFQDHPYNPGFLDTWTLMSWVAARTDRVHLSGNVLNLPLRQPAVLARSAASLDLLSGGRVSLGLGAGGFWDPIVAMGGERLTPADSVTALEEAIEIIRGIWDTSDRSTLNAGGDHHHVAGAKRGPSPAHCIPIWLGALKPRMLRLIGTSADGWLPSLTYLKPGDLQRGNDIINSAALSAGRDPGEITRLLNVSPDTGVDQLVELALEDGVSTFIIGTDHHEQLAHFATEIIPAVRDAVAEARTNSGTATVARVRSQAALAKRHPDIEYADLPPSLREHAVEPGDLGYARYTSSYLRGGAPGLVLRPQSVPEVADAITFAARHSDLPLGIFSAGHGISGRSINRGGLVIDVGALNTIEVLDPDSGLVRIGPGARWVEVAAALDPFGLAITSGDYGGVGVGGLATAGGVGWFARQHGLTIDHLLSVDVVTADGSVVTASTTENPELFWGMRGAGANFGIAVSFDFQAPQAREVGFAQFAYDTDDLAGFLNDWGHQIEAADRRVTGQIMLGAPGRTGGHRIQAMLMVNSSDTDVIVEALQPFTEFGPLVQNSVVMATYAQIMASFTSDSPQQGVGEPLSHSGLVDHLGGDVATALAALVEAGASYFVQVRAVGGAVSDRPADATAYTGRGANFAISAMGSARTKLDEWWETVIPYLSGVYLSFESSTSPDTLTRAFGSDGLERLRSLKRDVDPHGLFRDNFYVDPLSS